MRVKLPDFSQARVLVIGDLMLDRYWYGQTARISPEAPVPVVKVDGREQRPGGAGNVALNIAALGGHATVIGLTGDDEPADTLGKRLQEHGVACRFVRVAGSETVTKLRVVSRHQQLIRMDFEDGFVNGDSAALRQSLVEAMDDVDVVIFSDYGKGTLQNAAELIGLARKAGKTVLVDPKGEDFERYAGASVITPNRAEFEAVAGLCVDDDAFDSRADALLDRLDLQALLITRSEEGMSLFQAAADNVHLPTRAQEVYDVTGAGDTVIAVLGIALAAGLSLPESTALANLAAGVVVGKLGTATANEQELQAAMLAYEPLPRGLVNEAQLAALIDEARAGGQRVVMTNGCFDILHAGHVTYLKQAAALGDRLIVAVNDDASVRGLKGAGRPVNGVDQRMTVLAALESVDWVIPFAEETPERLVCALLPDVLVKGGDWKPDQIAGGGCVREHGGEVISLGFVDDCSTTAIIAAIREGD